VREQVQFLSVVPVSNPAVGFESHSIASTFSTSFKADVDRIVLRFHVQRTGVTSAVLFSGLGLGLGRRFRGIGYRGAVEAAPAGTTRCKLEDARR